MSEIQKFDPATLMQGVKDRIKATFVSLIPDEQWNQMVESEMKKFFDLRSTNTYNNSRLESDFTGVVHSVLNEECRRMCKEILASEKFRVHWAGEGYEVSEALEKSLMAAMPKILANTMSGMLANAIELMRNQ